MLKVILLSRRWTLLLCALLCAASATVNVVLLDFLNSQITGNGSSKLSEWLVTYLLGVAALFVVSLIASTMMVVISTDAIASIRVALLKSILGTKYPLLESTGKGPLLGVLTDDVDNLSDGLADAPQFLMHTITTIACFSYLAWLSLFAFAWFLGALAIGLVLTMIIVNLGGREYENYRSLKDRYYEHLHALFDGSKELATNVLRRRFFTDSELLPSVSLLKHAQRRYDLYWHLGEVWTSVLLFLALGVALAAIQFSSPNVISLAISYFVTITFVTGSLDFIVKTVSTISRAMVSARVIIRMNLDVTPAETPKNLDIGAAPFADWQKIELSNVTYHACHADGDMFELGPISLTVKRGEVLFMIGGNGSGKSTCAKVLNGLYERSGGDIKVDDCSIEIETPAQYRALFATVYSDYYLFPSILSADGAPIVDSTISTMLVQLGLDDKVHALDGRWSTTALSQGQRKRLALLQAWLDDASVYVLDEWAADQDPGYRAHFYEVILPTMKAQGKTLVVISHDERYFHVADRICRFEGGLLASVVHQTTAGYQTPAVPRHA